MELGISLTIGNPTTVYDAKADRLLLLFNTMQRWETENEIICGQSYYKRHTHVLHSTGSNMTRFIWDGPLRDITASITKESWRWYAVGPGAALQLQSGRLVVPSNHAQPYGQGGLCTDVYSDHTAHAIYSDDSGVTWRLGGVAAVGTSEGALAELDDGRVLFNMRSW